MSIQKRERDGQASYRVQWREDGRQRSKTFTVKRDAELFDAEIVRRKRLGTLASLDGGTRTLEAFVTESWAPERAAELAPARGTSTRTSGVRTSRRRSLRPACGT